jgi:hypothetical protein
VLVELGEEVDGLPLGDELEALASELTALWPRRNRPGGMRDSLQKLLDSKRLLQR